MGLYNRREGFGKEERSDIIEVMTSSIVDASTSLNLFELKKSHRNDRKFSHCQGFCCCRTQDLGYGGVDENFVLIAMSVLEVLLSSEELSRNGNPSELTDALGWVKVKC